MSKLAFLYLTSIFNKVLSTYIDGKQNHFFDALDCINKGVY